MDVATGQEVSTARLPQQWSLDCVLTVRVDAARQRWSVRALWLLMFNEVFMRQRTGGKGFPKCCFLNHFVFVKKLSVTTKAKSKCSDWVVPLFIPKIPACPHLNSLCALCSFASYTYSSWLT